MTLQCREVIAGDNPHDVSCAGALESRSCSTTVSRRYVLLRLRKSVPATVITYLLPCSTVTQQYTIFPPINVSTVAEGQLHAVNLIVSMDDWTSKWLRRDDASSMYDTSKSCNAVTKTSQTLPTNAGSSCHEEQLNGYHARTADNY